MILEYITSSITFPESALFVCDSDTIGEIVQSGVAIKVPSDVGARIRSVIIIYNLKWDVDYVDLTLYRRGTDWV